MRGRFHADPCLSHIAIWMGVAGNSLKPDREMAQSFLQRLDPEAQCFSFRTFSDTPYTRQSGCDPLERAIYGSLDRCWQELVQLNRAGAAVAVTINQTNAQGRMIEDIQRVRALFLDDDRGIDAGDFGLWPHWRVTTSHGHHHYYWLVNDVALAQFAFYQRRLAARYGGDNRVTALNQAMQLPGFWRRKRAAQPRLPSLTLYGIEVPYESTQLRALFRQ